MTNDTALTIYELLFFGGVAIGLIGMLATAFVRKVRHARRLYWCSWLAAGTLMALATLDRGLASACLVAVAAGAFALMYAYLRTPYVKLGDRIVAYTIPDSRPDPLENGSEPPAAPVPPDSYNNYLTAAKLWWTLVVMTCAVGYAGIALGLTAATIGLGAFTAVMCALIGLMDARQGFSPARRQFVQFCVLVIASFPMFLIPPLAYLAAYWAAGGSFQLTYRSEDDTD
ncbi:hypothetical protein H7I77_20285 [Mycolicibacterium novocastrense]|uniref:Transmembrane protein n=1 Tax=Mycolicibacterium novocastrense TaxID=59813 RepID=A0AAW5SQT7_MYCNV|nr:hypothetical protein [Mycolicibacterium novocastrense]MCV7025659.1 hypothetical protein [Mycolicibacterium novocastrense]GAT07931.1 uncharacterized protein RMCN_1064 [Mycolicibacterium novocastrense]